ncbi:MAG TPA: MBL fold metallo-hydrolase [Candidatus Acidoferrales bacterium]|nr:MBL fold metallo-hydrolase [Candidatus Acidoferrales bacterium]
MPGISNSNPRYTLASMPTSKANNFSRIAIALFALAIAAPSLRAQTSTGSNVTPDWCKQLPRPQYKALERVPAADPWFEVYKVAPGVFAIYEPHQFEEAISFLILGDKRALLFDTGMGIGDIKQVVQSLTLLPVAVLNSHTHNDHVGGNWEFSDIYGMDTDFTRLNAQGSSADAQAELAPGSLCGQWPAAFDPKTYSTRPFHITRWIHDGDTIDLGGRVLEVISTPGHTPDAICLLDRKNGLLFTGDSFYDAPIWLYRPETNLDDYVRSVERIAALAPELKLLLPSHNVPVADPSQLPKLVVAIKKVRAGAIQPVSAGEGKVTYGADGFVFLMAAPK